MNHLAARDPEQELMLGLSTIGAILAGRPRPDRGGGVRPGRSWRSGRARALGRRAAMPFPGQSLGGADLITAWPMLVAAATKMPMPATM